MSQRKKPLGRRTFLVGLLTGAGVAGALAAAPRRAAARKEPPRTGATAGMILYRRTKEAERYYRTLYV
jgi:hypothetical protein